MIYIIERILFKIMGNKKGHEGTLTCSTLWDAMIALQLEARSSKLRFIIMGTMKRRGSQAIRG